MALPGHVACQVVFENVSGLPRDRVTNTFHFRRPEGTSFATWCTNMQSSVINTYNATQSPVTVWLASFINDQISRSTNASKLQWYDLSLDPPHVPTVQTFTLSAAGNAQSMPNEVSLCGSFKGDVVPGVSTARQRGRVYIGPLTIAAMNGTESGGDQRPTTGNTGIIDSIARSLKYLAVQARSFSGDLCVFSPTANALYPVTSIWVDDAFDTQRRRGARALSRFSLSVP